MSPSSLFFLAFLSCLSVFLLYRPRYLSRIIRIMIIVRISITLAVLPRFSFASCPLSPFSPSILAKASSAQIPRQGHPTVRMEFCSYRRVAVTAVSFTTIPPGLFPGSAMSIIHSTRDYNAPTVALRQNVITTVLVTSTWWLSHTVDHFCYYCTKCLPQKTSVR